jgi:hypothetical protein
MNSHTSPCDHMIFMAKSSPERTQIPRSVTDRLTVRCLVIINPGRPRTSSTVAPRKPQHQLLLLQASAWRQASHQGSGGGRRCRRPHPPSPRRCRRPRPPSRGGAAATAEEVKRLKSPQRKVPPPLHAPKVNFEDACFSEDALPGLAESWKDGRSSRGPTTH